ncbi:PAS domain S-box protein [Microcoleus sp. FACHB-1515]|uniref:sensor histidine kinase n=1 Tax=Cyanophyceae TaxID=3028117 RepID=UPI00168A2F32|nr:ATP-binding protein [Microcoleus sp. FACHB-1515]MBD2091186.1 PAS domain S-box protein [Microcoleus sp. FACHB-1515]
MAPLQILCAATEATHALIAQTLLVDGAICHPVTRLADLEAALSPAWDAVIVTAIDGAIDPLLALHRVRVLSDLPFLVIGNYLSATEAVTLIKAGADDYLELHELARLPAKLAQLCSIPFGKKSNQPCTQQQLVALRQQLTDQRFQLYCQQQQIVQQLDRGLTRSQALAAFRFKVANATTVMDAVALLPPLCQAFGWDVGEIWVATAQALQPIAQWHTAPIQNFELHCSLAEAVLPSNTTALRLLDAIEGRLAAADAQGLQTVWSLPICVSSDGSTAFGHLGALIVYSRKPQPPQPDFLKLASLLTQRLGQLLKRQQSELALQLLSAIVAATEDGIINIDLEGRILSWNGGAERIYGYSAAEAIGQPIAKLIRSSDDRLWLNAALAGSLLAGSIARHPVQHQRKTGESIEVMMVLSLIHVQRRVSSVAILVKDITPHPGLDRLKDELISTISHELRTPIAALHGSVELLLSGKLGELTDRGQQLLKLAARNSDRLVQVTNNIFDLAQFAAGQVELLSQPCQIVELIEQAAIAVQPAAAQASINLRLHLQPIEIFADSNRITQVLTNLLNNAIKFSAAGDTIWLTVEQRSSLALPATFPIPASAESYVVIQVKDEGLGIPADRLEAIFQRFGQADASDARPQSGAGLGLTLCRSIAHRHQGHLWVESKVGQGSSFYLALPIAATVFPTQPGNTKGDRGVKNLLEVARGS